ncbi:MAG: DUF2076 domain-containing protein [Inquilinus limosus]|uniref:DUF2076 domain-containing protein n=1 Tax=Inquilinus limosus TaxID=171674 RepID=A0A952FTB5_9PROT|nr:DUF2076 domain-containing protein [Inquilinus limosus]
MTPQERELLTNLVARLKQAPPAEQDEEAVAMVRDLVRDLPDAPYMLAQTVLIQDYALHQAQSRIAELERQAQPQRASGGGSFLGAIFGSAAAPRPQPAPQPQAPAYTQAPPAYAPAQPGPWGGGGPFAQSSGPSFLRSAAATAAGVAGGALLFQGIESLFGAGHGGLGGFGSAAPGLTETVVNNYYGDAAPGADAVPVDDSSQGVTDADYQDDGSQDFGGDDFGGGGDDTVGV